VRKKRDTARAAEKFAARDDQEGGKRQGVSFYRRGENQEACKKRKSLSQSQAEGSMKDRWATSTGEKNKETESSQRFSLQKLRKEKALSTV